MTALHLAAMMNDSQIIKLLLEHKNIDKNKEDNIFIFK